jgi:hypothetical protein
MVASVIRSLCCSPTVSMAELLEDGPNLIRPDSGARVPGVWKALRLDCPAIKVLRRVVSLRSQRVEFRTGQCTAALFSGFGVLLFDAPFNRQSSAAAMNMAAAPLKTQRKLTYQPTVKCRELSPLVTFGCSRFRFPSFHDWRTTTAFPTVFGFTPPSLTRWMERSFPVQTI